MTAEIPKTHKEAFVDYDLNTHVKETEVPLPAGDEILIRVVLAASNPKDWKSVEWRWLPEKLNNMGEDVAGYVVALGKQVVGFNVGDRVSGYHRFRNPGGAYAEYAITPQQTTFHIPANITFEEALTLGTPAYTAGIALFSTLGLPAPWQRPTNKEIPLIIYGATTTVGYFAVQLAKASGIGPIIAIAGKSQDVLKAFLELDGKDILLDYRSPNLVDEIHSFLGSREVHYAFEASGSGIPAASTLIATLARESSSRVAMVVPAGLEAPDDIHFMNMTAATAHFPTPFRKSFFPTVESDVEFAAVLSRWFERNLANGKFKPYRWREIEGGLEAVGEGLKQMKRGEVSGERIMYRIGKE